MFHGPEKNLKLSSGVIGCTLGEVISSQGWGQIRCRSLMNGMVCITAMHVQPVKILELVDG